MSSSPDDGRMPLIEHLRELRTRLIKSVLAVAAGAVVCWLLYSRIFHALVEPYCRELSDEARARIGGNCKLVAREPLEGFSVRMTVASYGGIALAMPVLLWQLWRFIAPGLYKHERRYARGFVLSAVVLFALGCWLAFWSTPRALQWLNDIGGADLAQEFSPKPYLSFVTKMMIAFGIGFEFPVLLAFLQLVGVVTPQWLLKFWRHAIVAITIIVAVVTPSGDPITLLALTVPMCLFYFVAVGFGLLRQRGRRAREVTAA